MVMQPENVRAPLTRPWAAADSFIRVTGENEHHPAPRSLRQGRYRSPSGSAVDRLLATAIIVFLMMLMFGFHQALTSVLDPALSISTAMGDTVGPDGATVTTPASTTTDLAYRRFANALPVFALGLILLGLTRRPLLSLWLSTLVAVVLYAVDSLKVANLHAHLLPADALLLPQILDSSGLYLKYIEQADYAGSAIALVLLTVVFCIEPPWRWLRPLSRVLLSGSGLLLGYAIVSASPFTARWYDSERLAFEPWTPDASIERAGLIASLVKLSGDTTWQHPTADDRFVQQVLTMHPDNEPAPAGSDRPDIIVWQSESLFDPAHMNTVIGETSHLPGMSALRARSLHGEMRVPTYAGGTVRTEFEAMTGYPLSAFHGVSYPYSALAQRPLMALPRQLRDHGYRTMAIHPFDGNFWSRNRAFVHMGFDRFDDETHFDAGDRHGYYIGDDALLRHVASALDQSGPEPLFLFAISMENHGPWHDRPGIDRSALAKIAVPETLSPDAVTQIRHYLYHLHRADRTLAELIRLVEARDRHTIVLFYGDHLPGLDSAFGQVGFKDGIPAWEQPVPFLLFDNRGGTTGEAGGVLRSYHLASLILDAAGLRDNSHFRVISADRERHGRTGLVDLVPDPALDYHHAIAHLSWHAYDQPPSNVPDAAAQVAPAPHSVN